MVARDYTTLMTPSTLDAVVNKSNEPSCYNDAGIMLASMFHISSRSDRGRNSLGNILHALEDSGIADPHGALGNPTSLAFFFDYFQRRQGFRDYMGNRL